jgi:cytochrome bd-type quinol oxidase subunit 1
MESPKVYLELGVWMAEYPDGTFLTADNKTELEELIDDFEVASLSLSRSHVYSHAVAVVFLVGAVVILGICAVAGVL